MKTKKFLSGLALGAVIGGALGLFLKPDTGKKNREKFNKVAKQVSNMLVKDTTKMKKVSKVEYEKVVERLIKKYSKDPEKLMSEAAWLEIKKELLARWNDIQKELKKTKIAKVVKKVAKK